MLLNTHTYYSFCFGTLSVEDLLQLAKQNGHTCLALTDINNTSACFDFIRRAKELDIKPVIGIDRFSIYREQHKSPDKNLLVVIESKRAELFCRFYPTSGAQHEPQMLTQEEIASFIAAHPNSLVTGDTTPGNVIEAITCAGLAARATPGAAEYLPRPLYIRAPDVTFPKNAARQ